MSFQVPQDLLEVIVVDADLLQVFGDLVDVRVLAGMKLSADGELHDHPGRRASRPACAAALLTAHTGRSFVG